MKKYQCSSQEVFGFMVSGPISLCLAGCPQAAHALGDAAAPQALLGFPIAVLLHVQPLSLAQLCAWAWHWWPQHRHVSVRADEAIGISSMRSVKPEQVCSNPHLHYTLISHFQMNK